MPTIKVIINGSHILKVKISARKAKDIKLDCPEPLLSDTIAFFKAPESLILTEDNVAFLTGLCEKYNAVLNVKPVFMKRVAELQREVERLERKEQERREREYRVNRGKEETLKVNNIATTSQKEDYQAADAMRELLDLTDGKELSYLLNNITNPHDVTTSEQDIEVAEEQLNDIMKELSEDLSALDESLQLDNQTEINDQEQTTNQIDTTTPVPEPSRLTQQTTHTATTKTEEFRNISVTQENGTTTIKDQRMRIVDLREETVEQDPTLFVRVVSPKQRIVTKYKMYSPSVVLSPICEMNCDPLASVISVP
eukprot:sb/3467093/